MAEREQPLHIRVFLSSPGDVADERALARRLLKEELPYDRLLRGRVTFEVVSWDDPAGKTAMPATITPQEAVNRFGLKPSQCNVVAVVLWSRMGTHLDDTSFHKPNGEAYLSGTEWEFEDALRAWPPPEIFVYRRMEEPKVGMRDPDWAEKRRQYDLVERFFKGFTNPDGSFRRGFTTYETPTDFQKYLSDDLKSFLRKRLEQSDPQSTPIFVPQRDGSPYPGLQAFTFKQAGIFFGRGHEVDALIARLRDPTQRFLAVVGASGSGKSSLIAAGLLPRLKDGAIEGGQHWPVLTFKPGAYGDNPLLALASKLEALLPTRGLASPVEIATTLGATPARLSDHVHALLADTPAGTPVLVFIDQFEELFTSAAERHRRGFIELLDHAVADPRVRVLATLRADFLPQCAAELGLAALLRTGTFVLGPPGPTALADMIRKPAQQAGLEFEDGLVDAILSDGGGDAGVLPLVAFCLHDLYRRTAPVHSLTLDAYRAMGGLRGAIALRAEEIVNTIHSFGAGDLDITLQDVFRALVHIDSAGKATRQWAYLGELMSKPTPVPNLVEALISGRLLVAEDAADQAVVTLAHEALLQEWPTLHKWLDWNRDQLRIAGLLGAIESINGVLILGSFTGKRKRILEGIRDELRKRNYLPIVIDIDGTGSTRVPEALSLLAHMARFVIADISDAKSLLHELHAIVRDTPSLAMQPIIISTQEDPPTSHLFDRRRSVLKTYVYHDQEQLIIDLGEKVIRPLEAKFLELRKQSDA
jgi:hypothetical protein